MGYIMPCALTQFATHSLTIASLRRPRAVSSIELRQPVVPVFHGPRQQLATVTVQDTLIGDRLLLSDGEVVNPDPAGVCI